jgi:Ser/Thr protein kinase RdoA (MazF antagonist)
MRELDRELGRELGIADQFVHRGRITSIHAFGNGNINDTFLVCLDDAEQTRFVLQRINTQVFHRPDWVMQNMVQVTEHIHHRLQQSPPSRPWAVPRVILTQTGQDHWSDDQQSFWRAISFIERSQSFDTMQTAAQAQEVGYTLGMFHSLISDLPPANLADTLEGFHITPLYLRQYAQALHQFEQTARSQPTPEVTHCLQFIADRTTWATVLEQAKAAGKLPLRLMHGDPKINNVLFDIDTGHAIGMVDLDTVKPGLVHYDIGDCVRSGCNPLGEETQDWQRVHFDPDLCEALLQGYLAAAHSFLTAADYDYLFDAMRLIAFELGLRFFSDYLAGDVYFKVKYPEHNLARALVQFQLTASIETQEHSLRQMIDALRQPC